MAEITQKDTQRDIVSIVEAHLAADSNRMVHAKRLSEDAIAVIDQYYDLSIYFLSRGYALKTEDVKLETIGEGSDTVGVLPATASTPKFQNFKEALNFARSSLTPTNDNSWYKTPEKVSLKMYQKST